MYKLVVSELAHEDLYRIISYIKNTLCAPQAATRFTDQVEQCYKHLKSNPLIYALCSDERLEKEGYRRAVINNYIIVFKVDEKTRVVSIYRFFYGAEDYPNKI